MRGPRISINLAVGSAIVLAGVLLRIWGVGGQPLLADEIEAAFTAVNFMEDGQIGPTMAYHPKLRDIILYGIVKMFGASPLSLRSVSLAAGILSIPLAGAILYKLSGDRKAALLASFFLAVEQVHITFSRQGIQETWTTFFFLAGVLLFLLHRSGGKWWILPLSGLMFGLGAASKFHALFPLLVCLVAALVRAWREKAPAEALFAISSLVVVPATVYLLTFIPWFGRGYGILDWIAMQKSLLEHLATHSGNYMDQKFDTEAWQWFLRPMGYASFVMHKGIPHITVAWSNPLVWMPVLPATLFLAVRSMSGKTPDGERTGDWFILGLFVVSYLPLAFSPRPIWLLSSLATLPFALMVLARALSCWTRGKTALLVCYLVTVVAVSGGLYPLAVGKGGDFSYLSVITDRFAHYRR